MIHPKFYWLSPEEVYITPKKEKSLTLGVAQCYEAKLFFLDLILVYFPEGEGRITLNYEHGGVAPDILSSLSN